MPVMGMEPKEGRILETYLGDGAYVYYDGYHVWLYTSDGHGETNRVALDPHVLPAFEEWLTQLRKVEERKPDA